ncbi:MAG TPA: hypothetical protein VLL98_02040 [Rickettsiales bacterium]|nr:hypothetical protein [Rickettsiales bacterium]
MSETTEKSNLTTREGKIEKLKKWFKNKLQDESKEGKKANEALENLDRSDFEGLVDWCQENNYYGFYNEDERDEKKTGMSADRMSAELLGTTYGGIAAIMIGTAILPFCPIVGAFIIAKGTIPSPIEEALKKYVSEETLGLLPLDKVPSLLDKYSDYAHDKHKTIDAQMQRFYNAVKSEAKEEKRKEENSFQKSLNQGENKKYPEIIH